MSVRNTQDNVECGRAFYSKRDLQVVIMCNYGYHLVCAHAKYCDKCGHFVLKNSAMMCPKNNKGNYIEYKKQTTPNSKCGCMKGG